MIRDLTLSDTAQRETDRIAPSIGDEPVGLIDDDDVLCLIEQLPRQNPKDPLALSRFRVSAHHESETRRPASSSDVLIFMLDHLAVSTSSTGPIREPS